MRSRTRLAHWVALALAVGLPSAETHAAPPGRHAARHHAIRHLGTPHPLPAMRRAGPSAPDMRSGFGPYGYVNPGYVFVPGRGILDEDCDMPTSTCPNDMRDTQ